MSTPPFLSRYFIQWLASRTMERAQSVVTKEVQARLESGDFGDYQGVLFTNGQGAKSAPRRITAQGADFGVVAVEKRELVGVIDALDDLKTSVGDGFKFYAGALKGRNVVAIETGAGVDRIRRGVEALLQAFRPLRIVSVGFARNAAGSLASGKLFAPNRLLDEQGAELNLSELAPSGEASDASPDASLDFLSNLTTGALMTVEDFKSVPNSTFGAVAYDLSALTVARVCSEAQATCLILRVIFDAASAARSAEAARVLQSGGGVARSLGALFGATLKKPSAALDVARVKTEEIESADQLARALKRIASLIERAEVRQPAPASESASEHEAQ